MSKERINLGREGEELAKRFLRAKGYRIIESNFRTPFGEIDLIAFWKKVLVFIEVRTRTSYNFGTPEESISREKKRKISKVASLYLKAKKLDGVDCRFDVVALILNRESSGRIYPTRGLDKSSPYKKNSYTIKLIKDAFQL